jgi:3-hydroxybutyryl-CoA dehydratase
VKFEPVRPLSALRVGDRMPDSRVGPITLSDIVRCAGATGDFNPIHHDAAVARGCGYPDVFSMGILQAGVIAVRLGRWVGVEPVRRLSLRFVAPVWVGDVICVSGKVTAVDAPQAMAEIGLYAARADGDIVVKGHASVSLRP